MRARGIKPDFFTDEGIVDLTPWARLLFIGLWCVADRAGRMADKPKQLKIKLFPCDAVEIEDLLDELSGGRFITRYEVGEARYIQVNNFPKHQSPHVKEAESTIPAPCMPGARTRLAPEKEPRSDTSVGGTILTADCGLLTVDTDTDSTTPVQAPEFDEFWGLYPRKVGKRAAETRWKQAVKQIDPRAIMAALRGQLPTMAAKEPQYIPHPATWLNQGRWLDEAPKQRSALEEVDRIWGGGDDD